VLVLDGDADDDPVITALRPHFTHARPVETVVLGRGSEERMRCRVWVLEGWGGEGRDEGSGTRDQGSETASEE
jgi:hypothetical protein